MKEKWIQCYLDIAERISKLSYARRLKVGSIIVKNNRIISMGYNGTPFGWDNSCENLIEQHEDGSQVYETKPEVIHAERNALDKLSRHDGGGEGAIMFCTHAPCIECSKSIHSAGITQVYYRNDFRLNDGIEFLKKCGVTVTKIEK